MGCRRRRRRKRRRRGGGDGGGVVVAALGTYCKTYESYKMNKINVPLCGAGEKKWEVGGRAKT